MKLLQQCEIQLRKLIGPTRICKICFKPIKNNYPYAILHKDCFICADCDKGMGPRYRQFRFCGIEVTRIYDYNETIKTIIYTYKGCYDIELASVFLEKYAWWIRIRFHDFYIVPIPSYKDEDDKRGFNHIREIAKNIGLPMLTILQKTEKHKQAKSTGKQRKDITKYMVLSNQQPLTGKRVLILDDVFTTGSTLKAAIRLVKSLHPKEVKCLIISKTRKKKRDKTSPNK